MTRIWDFIGTYTPDVVLDLEVRVPQIFSDLERSGVGEDARGTLWARAMTQKLLALAMDSMEANDELGYQYVLGPLDLKMPPVIKDGGLNPEAEAYYLEK